MRLVIVGGSRDAVQGRVRLVSACARLQSRAPLVGQFALWVLTVSVVALAMQPPPGHHLMTLAVGDATPWEVSSVEENHEPPLAEAVMARSVAALTAAPASTPSPTPLPSPTPSPSPSPSSAPSSAPSSEPSSAPAAASAPAPAPEPVAAEPACEDEAHVCRGQRLWGDLDRLMPSGWEVRFEPGRQGILGWASSRDKRLTIFMRDSASDSLLRHVMLHELGHAHDFAYLDREGRSRWKEARGLSGDWYPCGGCDDRGHPAGDWAESFAVCLSGMTDHFSSELGPPPDDDQCDLLRELAGM